LGTVVQRKRLTELPVTAAMTDDMWLYVVDPTISAVINQSRRVSAPVARAYFAAGAGLVTSVFGRVGAVVAVAGDYTAAQVTNVPAGAIAAIDVQAAIDELDTEKQPVAAALTSISGLVTAADNMIYTTALDTYAVTNLSAFGRSLIDDANAAAAQTTLALVPGTNVQAYDAFLTSIATLGTAADRIIYTTGVDTAAETIVTAFVRTILDDANAAAVRTTIGAGTATLPMDDDNAVVFKTATPANTLTLNVDAFSAARVWAFPDAASTVAGLSVANVFTVPQMIDGTTDAIQLRVQAHSTQTQPLMLFETSAGVELFRLHANTSNNVFLGRMAGLSITSGTGNCLFGYFAGREIENGSNNVAIGTNALRNNVSATGNFALGSYALSEATSNSSIAVGINALRILSTAIGVIGIGFEAGRNHQTGNYGVYIGYQSAHGAATYTGADGDVCIGYQAGYNLATNQDNCVFIGYQAGYNETTSNKLYIANSNTATPLIYGDFATGLLKFHTVDAGTTTIPNTVSLAHLSSGTPAAGFGVALRAGLQSSTTAGQDAGRLTFAWIDPTHASRAAKGALTAFYTATERTCIGWGADASAPLCGFYNIATAPIAQPAAVADATGAGDVVAQLNALLARIRSLGLIAT